jgi:hypothetical protein
MAYPVFIFRYGEGGVYDGGHRSNVMKDVIKEVGVTGNLPRAVGEPTHRKGRDEWGTRAVIPSICWTGRAGVSE